MLSRATILAFQERWLGWGCRSRSFACPSRVSVTVMLHSASSGVIGWAWRLLFWPYSYWPLHSSFCSSSLASTWKARVLFGHSKSYSKSYWQGNYWGREESQCHPKTIWARLSWCHSASWASYSSFKWTPRTSFFCFLWLVIVISSLLFKY